jgi:hypothetical protein
MSNAPLPDALLQVTGRLRWWPGSLRCGLLLMAMIEFASPRVLAAPPTGSEPEASNTALGGVVVDNAERPVAGAAVWLLGGKWDDELLQKRAATATDNDGRFRFQQFTAEELLKPDRGQQLPSLLVRDARNRLGWFGFWKAAGARTTKIKLREVADFRGTVLDSSGKPIAGATVSPISLNAYTLREQFYDDVLLPTDLAETWQTKTAADGGFVLANVPVEGSLTARITAAGFGAPLVRWDLGKQIAIRLEPAGTITGAVELPDGVERPSKLTVELWRLNAAPALAADFRIEYASSTQPAKDLAFDFPNVPPGEYEVRVRKEQRSPVFGDPAPPVVLSANGHVDGVQLILFRAVVVRGVAVDKQDKKPLKDVTLRFSFVDSGQWHYLVDETTDGQGRVTAYVSPGKIGIQPFQTPPGYLPAYENTRMEPIDAENDTETVIEVERALRATGTVVDNDERPVPNAELHFMVPSHVGHFGPAPLKHADASGLFALDDVDPSDNLPARARSATAVTDGVVLFRPEQLREPLRLEIREENACHLTGSVVDESGLPLKHSKGVLSANRAYESLRAMRGMSTGVFVEDIETGDDGRFLSQALWPGESYQVTIAVDGFERAESKRLTGEAAETLDVGTIILRRNNGFVAGRIVDSSGKPVEGVTVFNSGDGLHAASVVTDDSGQFRLQGLYGGPVYVFARKPGYRFTGLRTTSGTDGVKVVMLAQDEAPAADQPEPPPVDTSQHVQLARWMLEQLWELPAAKNKWVLVRCMARLDAQGAAAWAATLDQNGSQQVTIGIVERLVDEARQPNLPIDYEKALAVAKDLSDERGYETLATLAEQTITRDPQHAWQLADAALLRARKLPPPQYTSALAKLGVSLVRLGRADDGRKLIDEAADAAEHFGKTWAGRDDVIAAIAPYDLPRAKGLIEPTLDTLGRNRLLAALAAALATHDLNEALGAAMEIKGDVNANSVGNHALMQIALRIAPTQLDDAIRVVSLMDGDDSGKLRAEALAWIAVAIAPRNKKTAYKLIDQSLDILLEQPDAFRSWGNYGGRCAMAAWIARQAREIGYPDMESVVMRVLATRPTMRDEYDPIRRLEAKVAMALILGFSAPGAARQVLEECEPFGQLVGSGFSNIRRGQWIEAWALADPVRAKVVFQQELAPYQDQDIDLQQSDLTLAADLLSLPARQWPRHFVVDFGAIWYPGEEWMIKWGRLRP